LKRLGLRLWLRLLRTLKLSWLWNQAICDAASRGELKSVRRLHLFGANLRTCDDNLLCRACERGHLDVVRYLQENGVPLNARDNEPLCRACDGGQLDVVRYLHQNGVTLNVRDNEPLCRAAAAGRLELVRYLHEQGGDISARDQTPLRRAAAGRHAAVVRYLHKAGAATRLLTTEARQLIEQMREELRAAPAVDHPSAFWTDMGRVNERMLDWAGEANFKRALNQNYFNFIPVGPNDARMLRMRRLVNHLGQITLDQYAIDDPDLDSASWISWYPNYYIFKEPNRDAKRELYREYLALMFEYALLRDRSGLLATLEEPELGNPIRIRRNARLISQDIVNSVRERNSILSADKLEQIPVIWIHSRHV
jgi:hypothetical protein